MKPAFILLSALLLGACACLLVLSGCKKEEAETDQTPKPADSGEIRFVNELTETDLWILPDTEENRQLPSGTPTVNDLAREGEVALSLEALGGPGLYAVHMFDADGMYFGAAEVPLEAGYTLRFRRQDYGWVLDITDRDGKPVDTLDVFGAMWAGDGGDDLELEDSEGIDG